ncbi:MAG: histidine phosphatase family protein [Acidobacteriota bacterium]
MKTKIWLIRHGATDWNNQLRWQGHTDIPLNEEGRSQAERLAGELHDRPLGAILSSDLRRARQTADAIATRRSLEVQPTERLREVDVGDLEGLTTPEVIERFDPVDVSRWRDERDLDWPFPNGETKREALIRGLAAVEEFMRQTTAGEMAVVCHSLILRVMLYTLFPTIEERVHVPNCQAFEIQFDEASNLWTAHGELAAYLPQPQRASA